MAKTSSKSTYNYRYTQEELGELEIVRPLSKKQQTYLNDEENDICVWGGSAGSGKSQVSLIDLLVNGYEDQHFRAMLIRKTKEVCKTAGGLWDTAEELFAKFGIKPRGNSMDFKFPEGAFLKFGALERARDKHNYQGSQCTRFLLDEAQQLPEEGVLYLISRLRSKSKAKHQIKMTCNPEKNSYLCEWLVAGGYLDDQGFPIKEMDGVTTYMCEVAGETVFKKTLEEFVEEYGKEMVKELEPQKFVFYAASVYDNPWIRKYLPSYIGKLKNLPNVERMKLYEGCWFADVGGGSLFKEEWVTVVDAADVPYNLREARAYDKAGTKPNPQNKDPDWTVGLKGKLDQEGNLWVTDMVRLRDRPAVVQQTIEKTAKSDGTDCTIAIPRDVGSAGKEASDNSKARLMRLGYTCRIVSVSKGKAIRFEPVSILAQERKIYVVRAPWNKAFFAELETLDFNIRQVGRHDDIADALSDLLHVLQKANCIPVIKINQNRRIGRNTRL